MSAKTFSSEDTDYEVEYTHSDGSSVEVTAPDCANMCSVYARQHTPDTYGVRKAVWLADFSSFTDAEHFADMKARG